MCSTNGAEFIQLSSRFIRPPRQMSDNIINMSAA